MSLQTYLKFFQILSDLELNNDIDSKQKHQLKVNFTMRDPILISLLQDSINDEEIKFSILNYIGDRTKSYEN